MIIFMKRNEVVKNEYMIAERLIKSKKHNVYQSGRHWVLAIS
jgi:hypothetical protein